LLAIIELFLVDISVTLLERIVNESRVLGNK